MKNIDHLLQMKNSINDLKDFNLSSSLIDDFSNKRVVFCTMGKSAFACRKAVYTARSFGLDWHDLDVCHAFHGDGGLIKKDDLLVFVSKSGNTKETVAVAKYFNQNKRFSITSNLACDLKNYCEKNLFIEVKTEGSPFDLAPMISTTLYMIFLHCLICKVVENKNIGIETFAKYHPGGSIGEILKNEK